VVPFFAFAPGIRKMIYTTNAVEALKHDNFERPVLVLRKFNRDAVLVVPLTSRPKQNPFHAMFHHEGETFSAVVSQIRLVSTKRLLRRLYRMDSGVFEKIQRTVLLTIQNRPPLSRGPRGPHGH
jgi:mRNA-degrading endonuclease toxin of MazEF toxin-antitoxin module